MNNLRSKIEEILDKHKELGYLKSKEDCMTEILALIQSDRKKLREKVKDEMYTNMDSDKALPKDKRMYNQAIIDIDKILEKL